MNQLPSLLVPALCGFLIAGCGGGDNPPVLTSDSQPALELGLSEPAGAMPDAAALDSEIALPGVPGTVSASVMPLDPDPNELSITPEIVDVNLPDLQLAIDAYRADFRRPPANLEQLVAARYLSVIPAAPGGKKYIVNQKSGEIESVNK